MQYRPEIDGLRAVAVLPVIFFHAQIGLVPGGFVGVDVFFVISGYLVTTILLNNIEQTSKLLIVDFYERRARRILPALFLVMGFTTVVAHLWMYPALYSDYLRSLGATALFISNVHFWESTDYFANDSELMPLLHTWSLAIEEQYYLLFPLILLAIHRFRVSLQLTILIALLAASLALSEWGWRNKPDANFYFTLSRFWELLVGSICAFVLIKRRYESNVLSMLGLAMILAAMVIFDATTPTPSLFTSIPVIGAALVILFAGPGSIVSRVLSVKILVGIGLVSFSAYLWHQPLFAFSRLRYGGDAPWQLMLAMSVVTLGLAYLTWRFVETPFRYRGEQAVLSRRGVFVTSAVVSAAFVALTAVGFSDGRPDRKAPSGETFADLALETKLAPNRGLGQMCGRTFNPEQCKTSDTPEYAFWGDSYTMHLVQAFAESGAKDLVQLTKAQCVPILELTMHSPNYRGGEARSCLDFNDQAFDWLQASDSVHTVFLSSPFFLLETGVQFRDGTTTKDNLLDVVAKYLSRTIKALEAEGLKAVIVSPPPRTGRNLGTCLGASFAFGNALEDCDFDLSEQSKISFMTVDLMEELQKRGHAVLHLSDTICADGLCRASVGETFIYRDGGHLSVEGARHIGQAFDLLQMANTALETSSSD